MNFQCHVLFTNPRTGRVAVLHSKRKHTRSYSLYSKHLTRTLFCTRTNITHIVIPLSLCKHTLFSKSEDHLFLQLVHFVRQQQSSRNAYGISERDDISNRESRTKYLASNLITCIYSFFDTDNKTSYTIQFNNSYLLWLTEKSFIDGIHRRLNRSTYCSLPSTHLSFMIDTMSSKLRPFPLSSFSSC